MTNEEAIERLKYLSEKNKERVNQLIAWLPEFKENFTDDAEVFKMAIAALRAQETPEKLDRIQWDGCPHCNSKFGADYHVKPCANGDLGARAKYIYDSTHDIVLFVDRHMASGYFGISYCPICGRPLTEQAWAELERRIST